MKLHVAVLALLVVVSLALRPVDQVRADSVVGMGLTTDGISCRNSSPRHFTYIT